MIFTEKGIEEINLKSFLYSIYGIEVKNEAVRFLFPGVDISIIEKILNSTIAELSFNCIKDFTCIFEVKIDKKYLYSYEIRFIDDVQVLRRILNSCLIDQSIKSKIKNVIGDDFKLVIEVRKVKSVWDLLINVDIVEEKISKDLSLYPA